MKRRVSYLICGNIIMAIFLGGLLSFNSINAYQQLSNNDQLLYKILKENANFNEYQVWLETNAAYPYEYEQSRWNFDHYVEHMINMQSYRVTNAATDYSLVNETTTSYDTDRHSWGVSYLFDYNLTVYDWVIDYNYDNYDTMPYNYSFASYDVYRESYPNITYFDPLSLFSNSIYNYSTVISLKINGVIQSLNVDVYTYEYGNDYSGTNTYYDLSYTMFYSDVTQYVYYVDPVTSLIVQIDESYSYTGNGTASGYSADLQTNVNITDCFENSNTNTWLLYETTVAYGGIVDADIPSLWLLEPIDKINNNITNVLIPTYISDYYSTVTVEIYIDEIYYSTLNSINSGNYIFSIPVDAFDYFGPYADHWVKFFVYDDSSINHNSTWEFWVGENRVRIPNWGPSYLTGPTNVTIAEGDYYEDFFVYSDTNWTVEFYKYDGGSYNIFDYWTGFLNGTVCLYDYGLTEGTYEYWIHLIDGVGAIDDIFLTVNVLSGFPPVIIGPIGDYYYTVGDDTTLWWQLFDDNPNQYEVKLDSTLVSSGMFTDGQSISFKLKNYIFSSGDYVLSILANDTTGFFSVIELYIHATGEIIDTIPPSISGPSETIYMYQGDPKSIEWKLYDDYPGYYSVYKNDTEIRHVDPWINNNENVVIDLSTLEIGTWYFEIEAFDSFGNSNAVGVFVVVELGTDSNGTDNNTETTTPNGNNTLNLDAPNILLYSLGFLSLAAMIVILRKRR